MRFVIGCIKITLFTIIYYLKMDKRKLFTDKIFTYDGFNQTNFINFVMENFLHNSTYTILVKFCFAGNSLFFMSGPQMGIKISNSHNINYYISIYNIILLRIDDVISKYDIDSFPDSIVISYKSLDVPSKLNLEKIDFISLNKSVSVYKKKKGELKQIFSSNYLPLTVDNRHFGYLVFEEKVT